jgi:hypothetical protein
MAENPTVVRGPLAPSPGSGVIYQVTLANGQIVTRPEAWTAPEPPAQPPAPAPAPTEGPTAEVTS